jgi:L,D-transpeptidase ErfK/SrfK
VSSRSFSRRKFCAGLGAAGAAVSVIGRAGSASAAVPRAAFPQVVGQMAWHTCKYEDTLVDLAVRYRLGYDELAAANPGVDPWVPGAGRRVVLPTEHILPDGPREGIILSLADMRLYYFPGKPGAVETYAIGTGREAWNTPIGSTKIMRKTYKPTWYVPASIQKERPGQKAIVPPGKDNPLGLYAFYLGWPSYLIHDTNEPFSVGRQASHGCVHLYPADIKQLFPRIPVGTKVTAVYEQAKIGWRDDQLLLEVHPSREQADEIEDHGSFTPARLPDVPDRLTAAAGERASLIDWAVVDRAIKERRGYPIQVFRSGDRPIDETTQQSKAG